MTSESQFFQDRADAGRQLAAALPALDPDHTLVVALPRGGVPVAAEICAAHGVPMDLVLVRKIGAPGQPELAVGAVTDGANPQITFNEDIAHHLHLSDRDITKMGRALLPEIERRRETYLSGRAPLEVAGKTVVVVDDGVATGATLRASLSALVVQSPERVIVALPVAPRDLASLLGNLADDVISLKDLSGFHAVGAAYRNFAQVSDDTVREMVEKFAPRTVG